MSQPEPAGWAYPVKQPAGSKPQAHFYQRTTLHQRSVCGQFQYRGQTVHDKLRSKWERCAECTTRSKKMGFIK